MKTAVVLCAGKGTTLWSFGQTRPKDGLPFRLRWGLKHILCSASGCAPPDRER